MLIKKGLVFRRLRQYALRTWETVSKPKDTSSSIACDVWLVCHPKDFEVAKLTLESARLFVLNRIEKSILYRHREVGHRGYLWMSSTCLKAQSLE